MSTLHYRSRMFNLKERLKISDNSWVMLKAYEDDKTGRLEEGELGRRVRLSHHTRTDMTNELVRLAQMMGELSSQDRKHCSDIITALGDLIKLKDQPFESLSFRFMGLPIEIRRMCYGLYIGSQLKSNHGCVAPIGNQGRSPCNCAKAIGSPAIENLKLDLAHASAQIREEFMTAFYKKHTLSFSCTCEMGYLLERNRIMMKAAHRIKFYWVGPNAHTSIQMLRNMELHWLGIVISKETGKHLTPRERGFRRYFHPKRGQTCLTECLGIDELMKLRNVGSVGVMHASKSISQNRTDAERHSLERLLKDKIVTQAILGNN